MRAAITFLTPGRPTASGRVGPLPGDQTPMPTHQRIRGDEGGNRVQRPSPEALGLHRQSTTLIVSQPELPATKLLFEDPVLLDQVGDNILLMPMHPARNRQQEQLERESSDRHSAIVGALNSHAHRQLRTDPFFAQGGLRRARLSHPGAGLPRPTGRRADDAGCLPCRSTCRAATGPGDGDPVGLDVPVDVDQRREAHPRLSGGDRCRGKSPASAATSC